MAIDPIVFAEWALIGIAIIAVIQILNKFGFLGKTAEEKQTEKLYSNPAMTGNVNEFLTKLKAFLKTRGVNNPSQQYIQSLMPNSSTLLLWKDNLIKARGFWNDDESKVFNVFRNMKNQVSMYAFGKFFETYMKKSVIDYLDEFLDESELAKINGIVEGLPIA